MRAHHVLFTIVSAACFLSLAACSDPAPQASSHSDALAQASSSAMKVAANTPREFPTYTDTSHEVAEGARLFTYQRCAECHSDAGVMLGAGNGNVDLIATAIRDGRAGGMPAYSGKLTDAQIWQIAAFVKDADADRPDGETVRIEMDLTAAY